MNLDMITEVEAGLVTLTGHVVHDEVCALAAVTRLVDSNSTARAESKHPTNYSSVSIIPQVITIINNVMTLDTTSLG